MANLAENQITQLLLEWSNGNEFASEQLFSLVYEHLRQMARRYIRHQSSGHSLQTTDLIHEAYLKLANTGDKNWQSRSHFFGVAAQAMRHILVDNARRKQSLKRGGEAIWITLDENTIVPTENSDQILALNEALELLGQMDERKVRVVEMKFFGGLTVEEIAEVLKLSPQTVKRDWRFTRTWLLEELANKI